MEPYKAYKIIGVVNSLEPVGFDLICLDTRQYSKIKKVDYVFPLEELHIGDIIECDNKAHITFVYANRKGYTDKQQSAKELQDGFDRFVLGTKKQNILDEAKKIIYGDREKTYGHPAKNLETIAGFWTHYIKARFKTHLQLTPKDVCAMMRFVKESRLINTPDHRDSLVDIAGYTALQDRVDENPAS